ncbi:hypothetical protein JKP88DRAFT_222390 [Tribonema minus]|uniref:Secreted protein n=1 Tax=Tribonema minus TaxID=303371 RepID=A0A836CDV7_9STRA|nr:hypothetical protein JKP88DRAFT_222390 [Tribonema minus]
MTANSLGLMASLCSCLCRTAAALAYRALPTEDLDSAPDACGVSSVAVPTEDVDIAPDACCVSSIVAIVLLVR